MNASGTPLPPASTDAQGRARRLRRMRVFATALLAAMAAIFVATTWALPREPWVDALRAFAEAALIGGLADWFAVTALFRHPLGLPIPHTGVVPARKDEIGRALARFIRDNFLVREAVERRLDRTDLAGRLGAWLDGEGNAARVTHDAAAALDWALSAGDGGEVRTALGGTLKQAFDKVPVSSAIATLLEVLTSGTHAQTVIDELVKFARGQLESHRVMIRVRIHERSPWWMPQFVDQEIYDKLMAEVERLLDSIAADPAHPARLELITRVKSLQHALAADPTLADKSRALQQDFVSHPAVRAYAHDLWSRLAEDLHAALATRGSPLRLGVEHEIRKLGAVLRDDPDPLSEIVSETIESWDPIATSKRIEQNIGTDLQFIRVNGTLVGGLVGLLIYLGSRLLG